MSFGAREAMKEAAPHRRGCDDGSVSDALRCMLQVLTVADGHEVDDSCPGPSMLGPRAGTWLAYETGWEMCWRPEESI